MQRQTLWNNWIFYSYVYDEGAYARLQSAVFPCCAVECIENVVLIHGRE